MPIYYINTSTGSDAANGSSWGTAWKTTNPLKALYTGTSMTDVELRFAKTSKSASPITLDSSLQLTNPHPGWYQGRDNCYSVIGNVTGKLKSISSYSSTSPGNSGTFGYTLGASVTTYTPAYGGSPYTCPIEVPSAKTGIIFYRSFTSFTPSAYDHLEFRIGTQNSLAGVTMTLNLCSDTAGAVPVQSFTINPPLLSNYLLTPPPISISGLTSTAIQSISVTVTTTTLYTTLRVGSLIFCNARTSNDYLGMTAVYIPTNIASGKAPKEIVGYDLSGAVYFNNSDGVKGSGTYDIYTYDPVDPTLDPALGVSVLTVGTPALPFKITGGWNTATNTVDGMTCLDARLLKLISLNPTSSITLWASDLVIANPAFNTWSGSNYALFSQYYYTGDIALKDIRLTNVYMAPLHMHFAAYSLFYAGPREADCTITYNNVLASCGMYHNNTGNRSTDTPTTVITVNNSTFLHAPGVVNDSSIGNYTPTRVSLTYNTCTFLMIGNVTTFGKQGTYNNCTFYGNKTSSYFSNAYQSYFNGCEFYGSKAGVSGETNIYDNCRVEALNNGDVVFWYLEGLWRNLSSWTPVNGGKTGAAIASIMRNCSIEDCTFSTNVGAICLYHAGSVTIRNTTFSPVGVSGGTAFTMTPATAARSHAMVLLKNVTFGSAYSTIFNGSNGFIFGEDVTFAGSSTKLYIQPATMAPNRGMFSNRSAVVFNRITTTNPNPFDFTANSSKQTYRTSVSNVSGVTLPDFLNALTFKLEKDTAVKDTAPFSWKFTLKENCGSPIAAEYLLTSVNVKAGAPITSSIKFRRTSSDVRGWLVIRPLYTTLDHFDITEYSTGSVNTWEELTVGYSPVSEGAIEVFMCITGPTNGVGRFEGFTFFQT